MPLRHLAAEVQDLIAALDSTDQLEVLLFLVRAPSQVHTVDAVANALALRSETVTAAFRALQSKRLAQAIQTDANAPGYQYAPATIALHAAVEGLALAYDTHPVTIIRALCEKPNRALQSFANAFRLRRRDDS